MSGRFADQAIALCRFAAIHLGWRPDEFWRATPADLLSVLSEPDPGARPPTRADIARLMEQDAHG